MKYFINIIKSFTDRSDHTLPQIIFFLNCIFTLLTVASFVFPLRDILNSYLELINTKFIADTALIVWYCSIFLFLISTNVSIIFFIIYAILDNAKNINSTNKQIKVTSITQLLLYTTHSTYVHVFDYITLTTFVLFFTVPNRLLASIISFYQWWDNPLKKIALAFATIGAIECLIFLLIGIIRKWLFPNYYEYKK